MPLNLPAGATLAPKPFKPSYSRDDVARLRTALEQTRLPEKTYAMTKPKYGITHDWVRETLEYWRTSYDIEGHLSERLGSLENYVVDVPDGGISYKIHFVAHFSSQPDAIPLLLLHGWPGSVLEFIDTIKILRTSTDPAFTLICPSQIGFGWSDRPPMDRGFSVFDSARILHTFMTGLGFKAYAAQGGDIGAMLARILAKRYDECKAININYLPLPPPDSIAHSFLSKPAAEYIPSLVTTTFNSLTRPILGTAATFGLSKTEIENAKRQEAFVSTGRGYAVMHATKPATIGLVVGSSPVALLSWLGEKFRDWVDAERPLSKDLILESVSMYWLLDMYPSTIYAYSDIPKGVGGWSNEAENYIDKPYGFSSFGHEIASAPQRWARTVGHLRFYRYHERGGHFAALEQPSLFAEDMRNCFRTIWPKAVARR